MNTRTITKGNKASSKARGFTIIEVVLVLAIAALIFLMIFVALPALQKGQRDTARKSEAGQIAAAVNSYRSNNQGAVPAGGQTLTAALGTYVNLNQIQGGNVLTYVNRGTAPTSDTTAKVITGAVCSGPNPTNVNATTKNAAVWVYVEGGGTYCTSV